MNSGNTGVITNVSPSNLLFIVLYENGGGAATVTFKAGDNPPAQRQGLGDLAVAVPASDALVICIEAARFLQDDDTIDAEVTTNNVHMAVFRIPNGA